MQCDSWGNKVINLYGPGYIEDYIGDVKFRISPLSFFPRSILFRQRNCTIKALEYADLTGNEIGMGFVLWNRQHITISCKEGKQVLGVEIVPEAIADAKINAKINGINNAEFFVGAAEDVVTEYFEKSQR